MREEQYYSEIEHLIKKNEIQKQVRRLEENYTLVTTYWTIGKILVEAQGGESRAKYGMNMMKKESLFSKVLNVFKEPIFLLLLITASIYFILGEVGDGIIMLCFILFITLSQ